LFCVLWPYLTGRPLTRRRLEYPEQFEAVLKDGPCVLVSSPAHLKRLPDVPTWTTRLQTVFSSGGPLTHEGASRCVAVLGRVPVEIYGSSETGGIAWRAGRDEPWSTFANVTARASPEGLLEVSSPHLPDAAFFTTADRVTLAQGTFRLEGRSDRIAKIEEKRVSLELIEKTAVATGALLEARVVPLAAARLTLGLVGVCSPAGLRLSRKVLVETLKRAIGSAVELVAVPRRYRFVDALPVDAQGKCVEARLLPLFHPERPEPTWSMRGSDSATLEMTIAVDLRVLDGHFPKAAVVPGVAQVDWAITWAKEAFPIGGRFSRLDVLKFQALMMPGHAVRLDLAWNAEKSVLTFKFTGTGQRVYSSGKVLWTH
jgi:acyl-coenzyme A synthetase/AMP-(fatty) acid ligase/3-hydroxymyristoyl/3-hydroxydecanoyl-(acyl carrier protein) dehydratase